MAEKKGVMTNEDRYKSPEELRAEINHIRSDMGQTIKVISDRLSAEHLKERFREEARNAGADRARDLTVSLIDRVRENPIPAAMAGTGLAFLFAKRRTAEYDVSGRLEEKKGEAKARVSAIGARARARREEISGAAGERVREARGIVEDFLGSNPLALVAAAFAIGAAAGLVLPETRKEAEVMGEAASEIKEKAREAAHGEAERVKDETKRAA